MGIVDIVVGVIALDVDVTALNAVIIASSVTLFSIKHHQESWSKRSESEGENLKAEHKKIRDDWLKSYSDLKKEMEASIRTKRSDIKDIEEKMQLTKENNLEKWLAEDLQEYLANFFPFLIFYREKIDPLDTRMTNYLVAFLLLSVIFALVGYLSHPEIIALNILGVGALLLILWIFWWIQIFRLVQVFGRMFQFTKPAEIGRTRFMIIVAVSSVLIFALPSMILWVTLGVPLMEILASGSSISLNIFFSISVILLFAFKVLVFSAINDTLLREYVKCRQNFHSIKERLKGAMQMLEADVDESIEKAMYY